MPAPLKIKLSPEEDRTLLKLSCTDGVPRRTKLRAIALRLNAQGYNVREIAVYQDLAEKTVRQTIQGVVVVGFDWTLGSLWAW